MKFVNFGGNVRFEPKHFYSPKTEEEVLDILNRHSRGKIRVIASGHAWSDLIKSDGVLIDMDNINQVEIDRKENGEVWVRAGAGCVLQDLLNTIHHETDHTLPTMGGIKKQTISGVISTGTHGSGRPSVSHYMQEIRIAAFDPKTGKAKIYEFDHGDKLRAARCSLGCMGVILSVKFRCVHKYYVAQNIEEKNSLDDILAGIEKYELQQFILMPYQWRYFVWTRRVISTQPKGFDKLFAYWIRIYNFLGTDILIHLVLKILVLFPSSRRGSSGIIKWFYGGLLSNALAKKKEVTDFSENAITLHHDLFRHLEMEIFVPIHNFKKAMKMIRYITSVFAGSKIDDKNYFEEELEKIGKLDDIKKHNGFYTHHYPIYCRQIKPDYTLISMTSDAKDWYFSISFFTYLPHNKRENFYKYVKFVAQILTASYDARLHWGKYYPLKYNDFKHLYPNLDKFRSICREVDPEGVFQNDYAKEILGF